MMNKRYEEAKPRRRQASFNSIGTAQLHLRNPYVVALWSVLFPGFGHILLSQYIKGFLLLLWEIFINLKAHVNLALLHSLLGRFEQSREAVDIRWSLLYIPVYIFTIWDSYRNAVELNKQAILAQREDASPGAFFINPFAVTYLDKRSPYMTMAWCAASPGLSHLALHRILHAVFLVFWWIVIVYQSNILPAVFMTCFGEFQKVKTTVNPQWLMNIPSLFFFCVYAAYVNAVESNNLFDREQSHFLKNHYQSPEFPYPPVSADEKGEGMYVVSLFKQTLQVELAVTALEQEGVPKKNLLAVPVEKTMPGRKIFDSMHSATGESVFDLPMIFGAFVALLGCVYGFILAWGPVIWGIIGGVIGFGIGFYIKLLIVKKKKTAARENEVVIFIMCDQNETEHVKKVLRDNGALGVSICGAAP
jgi:hypothetical protein